MKKCIAMSPENHWVNNFCLKFLYFGFILLLHFSIFIIMNIQWSKQPQYTWSYLWNFHFVVCFCYFWKDKPLLVLNLFTSEYLDQIPPWTEMKEAFSVKLQTENRRFCLRWKLSKVQAAQIRNTMQSSSTLIKISGPIPKVKKIWIDQRFRKYFCLLERIQAKRGDDKQVVFSKYSSGAQSQQTKLLYK